MKVGRPVHGNSTAKMGYLLDAGRLRRWHRAWSSSLARRSWQGEGISGGWCCLQNATETSHSRMACASWAAYQAWGANQEVDNKAHAHLGWSNWGQCIRIGPGELGGGRSLSFHGFWDNLNCNLLDTEPKSCRLETLHPLQIKRTDRSPTDNSAKHLPYNDKKRCLKLMTNHNHICVSSKTSFKLLLSPMDLPSTDRLQRNIIFVQRGCKGMNTTDCL